jgi:hypothetical protein
VEHAERQCDVEQNVDVCASDAGIKVAAEEGMVDEQTDAHDTVLRLKGRGTHGAHAVLAQDASSMARLREERADHVAAQALFDMQAALQVWNTEQERATLADPQSVTVPEHEASTPGCESTPVRAGRSSMCGAKPSWNETVSRAARKKQASVGKVVNAAVRRQQLRSALLPVASSVSYSKPAPAAKCKPADMRQSLVSSNSESAAPTAARRTSATGKCSAAAGQRSSRPTGANDAPAVRKDTQASAKHAKAGGRSRRVRTLSPTVEFRADAASPYAQATQSMVRVLASICMTCRAVGQRIGLEVSDVPAEILRSG